METLHGPESPCAKLVEVSAEADEMRKLLVFGDLFAAILKDIKLKRGDEFWDQASWKQPEGNWQKIAEWIRAEREQIEVYGKVVKKKGNYMDGILDEISQAAIRLSMTSKELELMILTYARRNEIAHLGIEKDCEDGKFDEVVWVLAAIRQQLRKLTLDDTERKAYERVFELYSKRWFLYINYHVHDTEHAMPDYKLNERGEKRRQLRHKTPPPA